VKTIICALFILLSFSLHAQYEQEDSYDEGESSVSFNFGLGLGMSYGGVGVRLSVFPTANVGVFGALGYNLHKAGYNFGGIVRALPKSRVCPLLIGMYGYNGVIVVKGAEQYNKTYYGPSFGGGMEIRSRNGQNFLNIELLYPVRSKQWDRDVDGLLNNSAIEMTRPLPVTFSIGYHMKFDSFE
jgi:hypothetical protein